MRPHSYSTYLCRFLWRRRSSIGAAYYCSPTEYVKLNHTGRTETLCWNQITSSCSKRNILLLVFIHSCCDSSLILLMPITMSMTSVGMRCSKLHQEIAIWTSVYALVYALMNVADDKTDLCNEISIWFDKYSFSILIRIILELRTHPYFDSRISRIIDK